MSNPQTFYTVGGVDLSNIFQPHSGTSQALPTGYKIPPNGDDLNTIFLPYPGPPATQAPLTNYNVNGVDLNAIFSPYTPLPFIATNYTYTYSNNYYTITFSSGSSTIQFLQNLNNINISIVGGGGGGAGTPSPSSTYNFYGSGGGGGGQALLNYNVSANSTYNINVGTGGSAGSSTTNGGNGIATTFDIFSVSGGNGGICGSNSSTINSFPIPNVGGTGGGGTLIPSTTNKQVIHTGNGGTGGAGGVGPNSTLSGSITYENTTTTLNWGGYGLDSSFYTNSDILCVPTTLSNYSGGGAGSASSYGSGGNGSGGIPNQTPPAPTNGQVLGAGGGGGNVSVTPGNGANGTCVIYFQYPQVPPPFSFNNTYNYQYISGYYYITFMNSGNFTLNSNITGAIIVAVGGGGGGAKGSNTFNLAGAGGAGGGAGVIESVNLSSSTYSITVGAGGARCNLTNGSPGGASAFATYISSSGGQGGYVQIIDGHGPYVTAGTTTVSLPYTLYGGGTGNGGDGGYSDVQINFYGANGLDSEIYGFNGNTGYPLPNGNNIYFSGGGGGGKSGDSSFVQGGTPGNGYGGSFGYGNNYIGWPLGQSPYQQYPPLISLNGLDAVLYGAGGGGGSENQGGNGANGIVMIIFQYP